MGIPSAILEFTSAIGIGPKVRPVIACSGGPDSTALAHAWMVLAQTGTLGRPTLCYIDHALRPDSAADGQRVAALAAAHGGDFVLVPVSVDREVASLEDAARRARYQGLLRVSRELDDAPVLLGHTASDQAETVLMRILRGTGVKGLAGIPARRERYFRPLLSIAREQVLAYLEAHQLAALADPMNEDPRFFRSRVRHALLPALRRENPALDPALLRLSESAAEIEESLAFASRALLCEAALDPSAVDVRVLQAAPAGLCKRALAELALAAGTGPLSARHRAALLRLVRAGVAGTQELDLPGGKVIRSYERLWFVGRGARVSGDDVVTVEGAASYQVRAWQPGDRMRLSRLRGRSRKLSDLYAAVRVPKHSRRTARVVVRESDGEIVWAEHIGLAKDAEVQVSLTQHQPVATNEQG